MSLEAIAALLGHRTLAMTMVYARIADRTVAEEYFAVSEKVEALYDQPRTAGRRRGHRDAQATRRDAQPMLGNGYCARPVEMDCHFESICESCTFFVTTIEFRPTLQRQRDDAERKGQVGRQKSSTESWRASTTSRPGEAARGDPRRPRPVGDEGAA